MGSRIYLLIKIFEKEEYADAFVQRGEMYCQTLGDFKRIDDFEVRGDAYEAVSDCHQPDQVSVVISYKDEDGLEHSFPLKDLAGPVIFQNSAYEKLNIYCMYAVKVPEFEESYDTEEERVSAVEKINAMLKKIATLSDEVVSLGHFAVVIYRVEDFIIRVKGAAKNRGFFCWNSAIKYYDPDTFHGSFKGLEAVFRKRNLYEYQNEYRFAFGSNEPEGHKILSLGALDGIAFKIPTKNINGLVRLELHE